MFEAPGCYRYTTIMFVDNLTDEGQYGSGNRECSNNGRLGLTKKLEKQHKHRLCNSVQCPRILQLAAAVPQKTKLL